MRAQIVAVAMIATPLVVGLSHLSHSSLSMVPAFRADTAVHAEIHGTVYNDANGNGEPDADEAGIAGAKLNMSGPVTGEVVTDSTGSYIFADLDAGTYTVCETPANSWPQTQPTDGPSCAVGKGYTIVIPPRVADPWFVHNDFGHNGS